MDTDGNWNSMRKRAVFVTTLDSLGDAVAELASSLGATVSRWQGYDNKGFHHQRVEFRPVGFNPFLLPRKRQAVELSRESGYSTVFASRREIADVRQVDSVPTQCIMVDAPNALYLCGKTWVPTHNTAKKLPWTPRGQINAHEDQLRAYILAFANSLQLPTSHVSAAIYYTRDKVAKAKAVSAPKSRLDDTARRFNRSWVDLKSYCSEAAWPCVSSPLCGWCPLVSVCPVAKADGKVAKLDGLPVAEQFDVPVLRPLDAVSYLADAELRAQAKLSKPPESTPDLAHLEALADQWGARNSPVLQLPASSEPDVFEPEPDVADDPAERSAGAVVQPGDGRDETATDLDPEGISSTDSSGSGGMRPYAAHVSGKDRETVNDARGDTTMATNFLHDDKPWEEVSGPSSTLNPNSYSAQAAFGIVEIAVESLHEAGFALRPSVVSELSQTLAAVVARVQLALTGRTSMQEGMNARLRGALRTALKTLPCPVGASSEELHDWVEKITRRTNSVAAAAIALWDAGDPEVPEQFTALAGLRRIAAA